MESRQNKWLPDFGNPLDAISGVNAVLGLLDCVACWSSEHTDLRINEQALLGISYVLAGCRFTLEQAQKQLTAKHNKSETGKR